MHVLAAQGLKGQSSYEDRGERGSSEPQGRLVELDGIMGVGADQSDEDIGLNH